MTRPGTRGRLFYGWIVVSALSVAQVISWGIVYYGFALFIAPMQRELGWSQTEIAGAFSTAVLVSAVTAIPIGRFIDRRGGRSVLLAGSVLTALLLIVWAQVETLLSLYLVWIGFGFAMAAVLYEPAFAVVVSWFIRRRALALTVLTSVGGLASAIFVPAIVALISARGWRSTLWWLAGIITIVNVPFYLFIVRSRPRDLGQHIDGDRESEGETISEVTVAPSRPSATVRGAVWSLALIFGMSSLASAAAAVHVYPFLQACGYSASVAALGVAAAGGAQVPARLAFAAIGRLVPPGWIAPSVFIVQAVGFVCLGFASHSGLLVGAYALAFGCANGLTALVRSNLVAERFDLAQYGAISGTVAFCGQFARAIGPIAVAWLATVWRYDGVWWLLALLLCAGAIIMRLLERRAPSALAEQVFSTSS